MLILFFCSSVFLSLGISITISSGYPYFFIDLLIILTVILIDLTTTGLYISFITSSTGIYSYPLYFSFFTLPTFISVKSCICSFGCKYISGINSCIALYDNDCHFENNVEFFFLNIIKLSMTLSSKHNCDVLNAFFIPSFSVFKVKISPILSNSSLESSSILKSIN